MLLKTEEQKRLPAWHTDNTVSMHACVAIRVQRARRRNSP